MKLRQLRISRLAGVALIATQVAQIVHAEEIPLDTTVNTVNRGVMIYDVADNGAVSMAREDFDRLGINIVVDGQRIALDALKPTVNYTLDMNQLVLEINAAPSVLSDTKVSLSTKQNAAALAQIAPLRQHNSFYANYGITANHTQNKGSNPEAPSEETVVFVPLETAWRSKGFLFHNSLNYTHTNDDSQLDRLSTSIEIDNHDEGYRVSIGDYSVGGNPLTGGGRFAGVKVGTSDEFETGVSRTLGRSLKGVLETPSEVEVYLGDQLISRSQLPAGRFELDGLPTSSITRDARIVITDVHGRQRSFSEIIYGSPSLLRQGQHEYSYAIGFERTDFTGAGEYEQDPTFLAHHRYGASERSTIGFTAEANEQIAVVSASLDGGSRRQDNYQLNAAASRTETGASGWAVDGFYNLQAHPVSIFLGASALSEDFANLATDLTQDDRDRPKFNANLGVSFAFKKGTLSLDAGYDETWDGSKSYSAGTSLTYPIGPVLIETGALATQTDDQDPTWNAFLRLRYRFEGGDQIFADFDVNEEEALIGSLFYEGTHIGGEEAPWRAGVLHSQDSEGEAEQTYFADVGTFGRYGEIDANASTSPDSNRYSLRYSGGYGKAAGKGAFGRPVGSAFAVVTGDNIPYRSEGLRLEGSGGDIVVKNRETVLVSSITPYSPSVIKAKPVKEQLNYILEPDQHILGVAKGGGRSLTFRMIKQTYVEGVMLLRENGEAKVINRAEMLITVEGKTVDTIIGDGGYFYLENVPPGSHPAVVKMRGKKCQTTIEVPMVEDFYVSLGEVYCEIN